MEAAAAMKVEMWPTESVIPYDKNPRYNDDAVDAVAKSIKEFGFCQPIVVDEHSIIIVGHTRHKAAIKLGLTEVPVFVAKGLTEAQARAYRIADNKTGDLAEWDKVVLLEEIQGLEDMDIDMSVLAFNDVDLETLKNDVALIELGEMNPPPGTSKSRAGQSAEDDGMGMFRCPVTISQEKVIRDAVRSAKESNGCETTGAALAHALKEWADGQNR